MKTVSRAILKVSLLLAVVAGILLLAGCDQLGTVATPGGTITVDVSGGFDTTKLQVVVVLDTNAAIRNGGERVYTFPVSGYADEYGNIYHIMSFSCPDVPEGDYFFYAYLDFAGDGAFSPDLSWENDRWLFSPGQPGYVIDISTEPYATIRYPAGARDYSIEPTPNYFVTDRFAAQLDIYLSEAAR